MICVAAYFWLKSSLQTCGQQTRIGGLSETFFGPPSAQQPKKEWRVAKTLVICVYVNHLLPDGETIAMASHNSGPVNRD